MIVDIHCHYTFPRLPATATERFSFESAESEGRPAWDSCLSPRILRRWTWRAMQALLGFGWRLQTGEEVGRRLQEWYERHLCADGPVERTVLLAFDFYHDDAGRRPPLPHRRSQLGSDMYTSNSLVHGMCRRHPDRFMFGASVHPYRADAVRCVEEVFARGACLLKWIPQHQNIDCRDERTVAVLRRCAQLGLPVLVHYGPEFTLRIQHRQYISVEPLLAVLRKLRREGSMPTTIVAHLATPVMPWGSRRSFRALVRALLSEFADAPLFADISAMTAWGKVGFLRRLARWQELHPKLLFGTDFPVPMALPRLRLLLGRAYRQLVSAPAWPQRAACIYRHLGFNEVVFHRAAELLANLSYFAGGG